VYWSSITLALPLDYRRITGITSPFISHLSSENAPIYSNITEGIDTTLCISYHAYKSDKSEKLGVKIIYGIFYGEMAA
jgi:hypothetical protein